MCTGHWVPRCKDDFGFHQLVRHQEETTRRRSVHLSWTQRLASRMASAAPLLFSLQRWLLLQLPPPPYFETSTRHLASHPCFLVGQYDWLKVLISSTQLISLCCLYYCFRWDTLCDKWHTDRQTYDIIQKTHNSTTHFGPAFWKFLRNLASNSFCWCFKFSNCLRVSRFCESPWACHRYAGVNIPSIQGWISNRKSGQNF